MRVGGAQAADRELRAVARVHAVVALDADGGARLADPADLGHPIHDQRRDGARPVAEPELEVLVAVTIRADLAVTHEQDKIDILSVCELVDEHRRER